MRVFILGLLLPLLAAGCTYNVPVTPSTAAAGAVAGKPRIETPVSYALTPELAALKGDADQVYVCSAHAYPIDAGPAIADSIEAVNDSAFAHVVPADGQEIGAGAARHILLALEDFTAKLTFEMGWWSGTAHSNVSLKMRATVTDASGAVLLDTPLSGSGFGKEDGDCDVGANALSRAANQAIEAMTKDYITRVVGSGVI
jgi:hypothetical protein